MSATRRTVRKAARRAYSTSGRTWESLHMMIADYLLAWTAMAAAITFGVRLLRLPAEERYAHGLFANRADGLRRPRR